MFSVSLKAMSQIGLLAYLLWEEPAFPCQHYAHTRHVYVVFCSSGFTRGYEVRRNEAHLTQTKNYSSESARDYFHPTSLPEALTLRGLSISGGAQGTLLRHRRISRDSSRQCIHAAKINKFSDLLNRL